MTTPTTPALAEPPADPFLALRVSYGMLLGVSDFAVLTGYPRGKHMLHAAWLHGSGTVRGFAVSGRDPHTVLVGRGLALDGWGRELHHPDETCLDVRELARRLTFPGGGRRAASAWLAAAYLPCPSHPVPALADPCDVSRQNREFSRTTEGVSFLLLDEPPRPAAGYPRLAELFRAGEVTPESFARAAAQDSVELGAGRGSFPGDGPAPVVLARLELRLGEGGGVEAVTGIDQAARQVLLPTALIQSLLTTRPGTPPAIPFGTRPGTPPGALHGNPPGESHGEPGKGGPGKGGPGDGRSGDGAPGDGGSDGGGPGGGSGDGGSDDGGPGNGGPGGGGPRVDPGSLRWRESGPAVVFTVTRPLLARSVGRRTLAAACLDEDGWRDLEIAGTGYDPVRQAITVLLDPPPPGSPVRLVVRGRGIVCVLGEDGAPLAGLTTGPPGGVPEGDDAVLTTVAPRYEQEDTR
ncbi:hypothetical protein [Nonomuraea sp. NPDC050783]|uniref:hypothetical protein n=1 Tax=Nonomuraea sp. NPDC050783 TaxID=3154634 RepID=UPI00346682D7